MNGLAKFKEIKAFVFDMDGVLSDGKVLVIPHPRHEGEFVMARAMNTKDGFALQLARSKGYPIAIISGGVYAGAEKRFSQLGIAHAYMGVKDKIPYLEKFMQDEQVLPENILYMGDDIPDYAPMKRCGMAACPLDAVAEIKSIAHYVSPFKGGDACVRDVIEKVMKVRGDWEIVSHTSSF